MNLNYLVSNGVSERISYDIASLQDLVRLEKAGELNDAMRLQVDPSRMATRIREDILGNPVVGPIIMQRFLDTEFELYSFLLEEEFLEWKESVTNPKLLYTYSPDSIIEMLSQTVRNSSRLQDRFNEMVVEIDKLRSAFATKKAKQTLTSF